MYTPNPVHHRVSAKIPIYIILLTPAFFYQASIAKDASDIINRLLRKAWAGPLGPMLIVVVFFIQEAVLVDSIVFEMYLLQSMASL